MALRGYVLRHRERLVLFLRYAISGVTAVAIQVTGLYVWVSVLGLQAQYLWGVVIAYCIALLVAFLMQKFWTFRDHSRGMTAHHALWYVIISLGNLGLKTLILYTSQLVFEAYGFDFFHGWYLIAQLFAIGVCTIVGFLLNWFITFRHVTQREPVI
jgi:putative flippase GtrA